MKKPKVNQRLKKPNDIVQKGPHVEVSVLHLNCLMAVYNKYFKAHSKGTKIVIQKIPFIFWKSFIEYLMKQYLDCKSKE